MNRPALNKAFHETHRFLAAVQDLKDAQPDWKPNRPDILVPIEDGRLTAAVKRASMDLTRALADLRKPQR